MGIWQNLLQTISVFVVCVAPLALVGLNLACIFNIFTWLLYVPYLLFIFILDRKSPGNGSRRWSIIRQLPIWSYFRAYFPSRVIKTHDLDPMRTYIFGMHPHGIIGLSMWANFFNDAPGSFSDTFPAIRNLRYATLRLNFRIPFFREVLLWLGLINADQGTIVRLLRQGTSVLIMIGGADEALSARPMSAEVVLKKRRGFVRCALQTGCNLVPVYAFGENDLFLQANNPEGSRLRAWQEWIKKVTGATVPAFYSRGETKYSLYGLMPHRTPLTTIIGAPIELPHIEEPSKEDVDKYHQIYIDRLQELYKQYRPDSHPDQLLVK